ncbi:uncharacterized protein LOC143297190 isoform X2 [Babylonia areolata]|uniref:uncharacterized protein LOC143297190 isoform X2 n=1 Tax=Babylonia areolata TaxID=304850 RepID=UPI003FD27BC9
MMYSALSCMFLFVFTAVEGIRFSITPASFTPGVTARVTMRCDVAESGQDMTQLLLLQLEREEQGRMVPVVTFTPGMVPHVMQNGKDHHVKVEGVENQFQNISGSYLAVIFPFPAAQVAGNYTCVLSGLSSAGLLVRYTQDATLTLSAVDELPRFMTAHVVELRSLIEKLRTEENALKQEGVVLQQNADNVTVKLTSVEQEYTNVVAEMAALQSRGGQLISVLNQPVVDLDRLSSVRPEKKVAFHAALSTTDFPRVVSYEPLVFDHVITNQGQGYDAAQGIFRAPVAGTYALSVSVEAGPAHGGSDLSIMSGADILQTIHMSEDAGNQHSAASTVVRLRQGQEVTCQFTWLAGNAVYTGSSNKNAPYITTFTGHILW